MFGRHTIINKTEYIILYMSCQYYKKIFVDTLQMNLFMLYFVLLVVTNRK